MLILVCISICVSGISEVKELFQTLRAKVTIAAERRALGLPAEVCALQCVAMSCSVLWCVAVCCSVQ